MICASITFGSHSVMANDVMKYPKRPRHQELRSEAKGTLDAEQARRIAEEIDKMMGEKRAVKTGEKIYGSKEAKINRDSWESDNKEISRSSSQRVSERRPK